jgi:uncharacterized FlgJ-related protein
LRLEKIHRPADPEQICPFRFENVFMTYDERIFSQATSEGIPTILATIIVAMARHETGNYTSAAFKQCNNCFGYKYVGQATAAGECVVVSSEGDPFAGYNSIEGSVHELVLWIKRRQAEGKFPQDLSTINTPDKFASLLKASNYYGDTVTNYTNRLIYWLQQIGGTLATPAVGATALLVILVALGLYHWRKRIFH